MKKKTVKKRIFLSNARMILAALAIILLINLIIFKLYWEFLEQEMRSSTEMIVDDEELEELLQDLIVRREEFLFVFLLDGILCAAVLIIVSCFFTGNLAHHIMLPLNVLSDGAKRIQNNLLTQDIEYTGDMEFEEVCDTFNHMQKNILKEQEKNEKYEKARTDMIAGISHDLRTPLTAIRGTLKGLLDGIAATSEQKKIFLDTAYRRTEDMDILLNQLFYLSKLETGNMPIFLQLVDIKEFVINYINSKKEFLGMGEEILAETNGITVNV